MLLPSVSPRRRPRRPPPYGHTQDGAERHKRTPSRLMAFTPLDDRRGPRHATHPARSSHHQPRRSLSHHQPPAHQRNPAATNQVTQDPARILVTARFEALAPVRRFYSRKAQRHLPGRWWSATDGVHVGYESWLECDPAR